jgi:hypothetical protein
MRDGYSRRTLLAGAGGLAMALATLGLTEMEADGAPDRATAPASHLPDIQFDITRFIASQVLLNDDAGPVPSQLPPVHTVFTTLRLDRKPSNKDQHDLTRALATIEQAYPFTPGGILTFIAYGIPYFNRLPGGMAGHLVSAHMPRLLSDHSRYVLEEAVPGPTDVSDANPQITKKRFNVPVSIEQNDLLLTLRSDSAGNIKDVLNWLAGSNKLRGHEVKSPALLKTLAAVTSSRAMFVQAGLPAKVAAAARLPYARDINPRSPMWMGFLDQQVAGSGPASTCVFQGDGNAQLTTATSGDYFDNGSIQHLSHLIEDLTEFYTGSYRERVQYLYRSTPIPALGNKDQFTHGGGPAYVPNSFHGIQDAAANASGTGTYQGKRRMGHLCGLQRSSRAQNAIPIHLRMDGPGFDSLDVPGGARQPKIHFTIFVPHAEFFRQMRVNQASLDLCQQYAVEDTANGIERFLTATRRQNFLVPPRRHRAFPLLELS